MGQAGGSGLGGAHAGFRVQLRTRATSRRGWGHAVGRGPRCADRGGGEPRTLAPSGGIGSAAPRGRRVRDMGHTRSYEFTTGLQGSPNTIQVVGGAHAVAFGTRRDISDSGASGYAMSADSENAPEFGGSRSGTHGDPPSPPESGHASRLWRDRPHTATDGCSTKAGLTRHGVVYSPQERLGARHAPGPEGASERCVEPARRAPGRACAAFGQAVGTPNIAKVQTAWSALDAG